MFLVYPYRSGSRSARALASALGGKTIKREGSRFKPSSTRHVVNWGACNCPTSYGALNPSSLTSVMRNKLSTFQKFAQSSDAPRVPRWTTSRSEAQNWTGCKHIVARTTLTGQSGDGIIIVERGRAELPAAPLYVEYIPKEQEYRVHVFKNRQNVVQVLDVQRKVRDPEREPSDWKVRSHRNGFIFIRNNDSGTPYKTAAPADVLAQAKKALVASGLHFMAVDIVYHDKQARAYVLEGNCAPGLEGVTVAVYRDAIRSYFS